MRTRTTLAAAALIAAGALLLSPANAGDQPAPTEDEAAKIAENAYVDGYPLDEMIDRAVRLLL
jgi:hypothetical protein